MTSKSADFGERLRRIRTAADLSRDELIKRLRERRNEPLPKRGGSQVQAWENEKHVPTLDIVSDLAAILGVHPAELAFGVKPAAMFQSWNLEPLDRVLGAVDDLRQLREQLSGERTRATNGSGANHGEPMPAPTTKRPVSGGFSSRSVSTDEVILPDGPINTPGVRSRSSARPYADLARHIPRTLTQERMSHYCMLDTVAAGPFSETELPEAVLRFNLNELPDTFLIWVRGDSMLDTLRPGELARFEKCRFVLPPKNETPISLAEFLTKIEDDEIYIVAISHTPDSFEEWAIKRVETHKKNSDPNQWELELVSDNKYAGGYARHGRYRVKSKDAVCFAAKLVELPVR